MNEGEKALKAIKFWIALFVLWFALFTGAFIGAGAAFIHEVKAYNSCNHVEDEKFTACYEAAKR